MRKKNIYRIINIIICIYILVMKFVFFRVAKVLSNFWHSKLTINYVLDIGTYLSNVEYNKFTKQF